MFRVTATQGTGKRNRNLVIRETWQQEQETTNKQTRRWGARGVRRKNTGERKEWKDTMNEGRNLYRREIISWKEKKWIAWTNTRNREGNYRLGKTLGTGEELIGWKNNRKRTGTDRLQKTLGTVEWLTEQTPGTREELIGWTNTRDGVELIEAMECRCGWEAQEHKRETEQKTQQPRKHK